MNSKLTDHEYLLSQVRAGFKKGDENSSLVQIEVDHQHQQPIQELLSNLTRQKSEYRAKKKEIIEAQREKRMRQLKFERLLKDAPVTHKDGWNFSIASDRATAPPHSTLSDAEVAAALERRSEPNSKFVRDLRNPNPWLPTCLIAHEFGAPSCDELTLEYSLKLQVQLESVIKACENELECTQETSTEEGLADRARASQALAQYKVLLEQIKDRVAKG